MSDSEDVSTVNWRTEALAVIADIRAHVNKADISQENPPTQTGVILNLLTLEDKTFSIRMSAAGFEVLDTGECDTISEDRHIGKTFETPYAMLATISPSYVNSFGNQLVDALKKLQPKA